MSLEDLGLNEDQLKGVQTLIESVKSESNNSDQINALTASVEKLEANNKELLGDLIDKRQKLSEMNEQALHDKGSKEELEAAIKERLESDYKSQLSALTEKNEALVGDSLSSAKKSAVSDLAKMFAKPELVQLTLEQMVETEMGDNGISYTFTDFDRKPVTTNIDDYRKWISEQPQLSDNIIASHASGSNAEGSGGSNISHGDIPKTLAACEGDPDKERLYFANQRQSMA